MRCISVILPLTVIRTRNLFLKLLLHPSGKVDLSRLSPGPLLLCPRPLLAVSRVLLRGDASEDRPVLQAFCGQKTDGFDSQRSLSWRGGALSGGDDECRIVGDLQASPPWCGNMRREVSHDSMLCARQGRRRHLISFQRATILLFSAIYLWFFYSTKRIYGSIDFRWDWTYPFSPFRLCCMC